MLPYRIDNEEREWMLPMEGLLENEAYNRTIIYIYIVFVLLIYNLSDDIFVAGE